jgi:hypothetical protein
LVLFPVHHATTSRSEIKSLLESVTELHVSAYWAITRCDEIRGDHLCVLKRRLKMASGKLVDIFIKPKYVIYVRVREKILFKVVSGLLWF